MGALLGEVARVQTTQFGSCGECEGAHPVRDNQGVPATPGSAGEWGLSEFGMQDEWGFLGDHVVSC